MLYKLFLNSILVSWINTMDSECICTTVPCPIVGNNNLIEGTSGQGVYNYEIHNDIPVVVNAYANISFDDLDNGSGTTTCTQHYAQMLDDENTGCDAGHILAHRLGGPGNQPINIFPQKASVNRGIYSSFEQKIYNCISNNTVSASLSWDFNYEDLSFTRPSTVHYFASFTGSDCEPFDQSFDNVGN